MGEKTVSTPVIVGAIVAAILFVGILGWFYLASPPRGADGSDLSKAGVQPANMSYGGNPAVKPNSKPGAMPPSKPTSKPAVTSSAKPGG